MEFLDLAYLPTYPSILSCLVENQNTGLCKVPISSSLPIVTYYYLRFKARLPQQRLTDQHCLDPLPCTVHVERSRIGHGIVPLHHGIETSKILLLVDCAPSPE